MSSTHETANRTLPTIKDLFPDETADRYAAEPRLARTVPRVAKAGSASRL